ncbi:MAG TPA: transcriptional regulator, partial [Anaerolineae bacterium]|nr:transcriptional regulator [Anaerolineae bacterium]
MSSRRKRQTRRQWRRVDLHLHTPASSDYQVTGVSNLDILRAAAARSLDIIAFTDHNSIAGYARMLAEIEELELLERLKRLHADERQRLDEYRRLRQKVLALPGFEFTATLGFHILGIFPETKSVREIEHILLDLNVPAEKLDQGSSEVGATVDVLTAYRIIDEAGGLAIAAHVNSSHGVAMRGLGFGGQTKIAYTQDSHLMALEVTDLEQKSKRTTAAFFNGTKPEYPRRMHCIQGSDAHRLTSDPKNPKNLGVGERVTELLLDDVSFDALHELFRSTDFARSRPYRRSQAPVDFIRAAREAGPSIVQSFHDSYSRRGGRLKAIIADVCAFANT